MCYTPLIRAEFQNIHKVSKKDGHLYNKAIVFSPIDNDFGITLENYEDRSNDEVIYTPIPCGQCIACRLDYSRDWATRCMLEAQKYANNWFVTLTYNDDNLPKGGTLVKEDLQKFHKDLRRYFEYHFDHQGIRYYSCGEYGSKNFRPHYHDCIFNLPIPVTDLKPYKMNELHQMLYTCDFLSKIWSKGFVVVGDVTWESCAYVARYMTKKLKGDFASIYTDLHIIPEFCTMSRKPGIAREFYDLNKADIYLNDEVILKRGRLKPPRYYDRLFDVDMPDQMELIKESRRDSAKRIKSQKMSQTDLSYSELLDLEHRNHVKSAKLLKRNIE